MLLHYCLSGVFIWPAYVKTTAGNKKNQIIWYNTEYSLNNEFALFLNLIYKESRYCYGRLEE